MRKTVLAIAVASALSVGCATVSESHLPAQWVTLRILEEERVAPDEALFWIERLRGALSEDEGRPSLIELRYILDWDGMRPSTRLLVSSLVTDMDLDVDSPLSDDARAALTARLDAIEQAVLLY